MKTKPYITIIALIITFSIQAQITPGEFSKKIVDSFQEMAKSKITNPEKDQDICKAIPVFKKIPVNNLAPSLLDANAMVRIYKLYASLFLSKLNFQIDKGIYASVDDKALFELSRATKFTDFVLNLTGMNFGDLDKAEQDALRNLYDTHPLKTKEAVTEVINSKLGKCTVTATTKMTPTNWDFPNVSWDLETEVRIDCPCTGKGPKSLHYANFLITAKADGLINSTTGNLNKLKDAKVELRSVICCSEKKKEPKETSVGLNDTPFEYEGDILHNIKITPLPTQTIGGSVGVGFSNDFDETNLCLGAEYLYNVTDVGNSSLFVGANVVVESNSFNDSNNIWIGVGPTVQLFTPISPNRDVHITHGISSDIIFGTNDNNGTMDDISGFDISINTGLNVRLNDDIFLSIMVPIVTHTNLEFTSQDGNGSFKSDATDIFFFKNSPVKFGIRIDLDK
jgi:hypothetical protein